MHDIATLKCDLFLPLVGEIIALADESGAVVLTARLQSASEHLRATIPDAPRTAFTLNLTAPAPCPLDSGHYSLAHPQMGMVGPVNVVRTFSGHLNTTEVLFQVHFN